MNPQETNQSRPRGPMQIEVISRDKISHSALRVWATDLIAASFHRFSNHIPKIVVRIDDVNGPRGGVDKHVTIAMQVRGGMSQVIRQRGSSYEAAIVAGLRRAKQVLQRSQKVGARRPSRGQRSFALG